MNKYVRITLRTVGTVAGIVAFFVLLYLMVVEFPPWAAGHLGISGMVWVAGIVSAAVLGSCLWRIYWLVEEAKKANAHRYKKRYCPKCRTMHMTVVRKIRETFPVLGRPTETVSDVAFCCGCGEQVFDEDLDDANLKRVFATYKKETGRKVKEGGP